MGLARLPSGSHRWHAVSPESGNDPSQHSHSNQQTPSLTRRARASGHLEPLARSPGHRTHASARALAVEAAGTDRSSTQGSGSGMACAGPREDGADPLERVSHSRQASRIPLKRKREAGDDTDVRPTSLPRRGEIAAFHTAACDADAPTTPPTTPRAESRREPTVEQLTDYGRWLGRTEFGRLAALREQQCARLWKLVASARRGKVDPDFCLHVARDNTLAQRNGYGLALMFLDGSVPPEENARRLDGYFFALGAASAPTHAEPHRQVRGLEQCVEMAACYLFKTRWFMDAPLEKLAELGNLLSKYPRQPASMAAIAWIAGQALETRAIASTRRQGVDAAGQCLLQERR